MIARRAALRLLGGLAATMALFAAIAGSPERSARSPVDAPALARMIMHEEDHVTARELAAWIRDDRPGLRVLDVRTDSEFAAYHIPSAERVALTELVSRAPKPGETLVLYSEAGAHAAQAWVLLRAAGHEHVYFLRGGLLDWMDDVLSPVVPADSAESVAALSRYFEGVPRVGDESGVPVNALEATMVKRDGGDAVARVRRRGC